MKYLTITVFFLSLNAHALELKSGKWASQQTLNTHGKKMDVNAEIQNALASMPKEQREMIMTQMNKNAGFSENGLEFCYAQDSLQKLVNTGAKCQSKVLEKTPTKMRVSFDCQDGNKGDGVWNKISDTEATGVVKIKDAQGKMTTVEQKLKFISSDCGKLKVL